MAFKQNQYAALSWKRSRDFSFVSSTAFFLVGAPQKQGRRREGAYVRSKRVQRALRRVEFRALFFFSRHGEGRLARPMREAPAYWAEWASKAEKMAGGSQHPIGYSGLH